MSINYMKMFKEWINLESMNSFGDERADAAVLLFVVNNKQQRRWKQVRFGETAVEHSLDKRKSS